MNLFKLFNFFIPVVHIQQANLVYKIELYLHFAALIREVGTNKNIWAVKSVKV